VRFLVLGNVGAKDQDGDPDAVATDFSADRPLKRPGHVLDEIRDNVDQFVGDLVDRKLGVSGHD